MKVWPLGPWLKISVARITRLRIVTSTAPRISEASSVRVISRISLKASAHTAARPNSAIHTHSLVCRIPTSPRNWPPKSPISIVEPQPIAV